MEDLEKAVGLGDVKKETLLLRRRRGGKEGVSGEMKKDDGDAVDERILNSIKNIDGDDKALKFGKLWGSRFSLSSTTSLPCCTNRKPYSLLSSKVFFSVNTK